MQPSPTLASAALPNRPPDSTAQAQVPRLSRADSSDLTPPSRSLSLFDRLHISPASSTSLSQRGVPAHHPGPAASSSSALEASRAGPRLQSGSGSGSGSGSAAATNSKNTTTAGASTTTTNTNTKQKYPANLTCPLCSKRFTRSYNLRSHLRTHNNERPFECSVCGKAFARQHDRKRHERLHLGEKQFICRGDLDIGGQWGCGRAFSRVDGLARHLRSDMGSDPHPVSDSNDDADENDITDAASADGIRGTAAAALWKHGGSIAHGSRRRHDMALARSPDDGELDEHGAPSRRAAGAVPSLARMSWSPAAASPSADPFSAIESLFDFDSGTTSDAAGSRTPGAGSAYTKWWSSYTDASSGMKAQEHGEAHPDPGQYR
ncbi:hypothetical protein ACCO45_011938 [Purpureocillium lilacinum]|uniref:Uncharacterized protein n=1 Tax=Purpureocillium lilacinum TaxID=33203 RepID=A0ACC4DCU9_PURLI